jgi:hypothetical protein
MTLVVIATIILVVSLNISEINILKKKEREPKQK